MQNINYYKVKRFLSDMVSKAKSLENELKKGIQKILSEELGLKRLSSPHKSRKYVACDQPIQIVFVDSCGTRRIRNLTDIKVTANIAHANAYIIGRTFYAEEITSAEPDRVYVTAAQLYTNLTAEQQR